MLYRLGLSGVLPRGLRAEMARTEMTICLISFGMCMHRMRETERLCNRTQEVRVKGGKGRDVYAEVG